MRERLKDFFEVYEFYSKTGVWTSTKVYGIMSEAYMELQSHLPENKRKRLDTGCSGCINKVAKEIYKKWH